MNKLRRKAALIFAFLLTSLAFDGVEGSKAITAGFGARTTPSANEQKVDDIFSLLADIEHGEELHKFSVDDNYSVDNERENLIGDEAPPPKGAAPSTLKTYFHALNSLSKTALGGYKPVVGLLSTVQKVSEMYETERQKRAESKAQMGLPKNDSASAGVLKSTSKAIGFLLEPENMEKVFDISRRAHGEDEILEELASIILSSEEDRSGGGGYGYGLTLDPVTCIALLTLAAYLIRAVFQILTATAARRSFASGGIGVPSLEFSDMPSVLVHLHNFISKSELEYGRSKREIESESNESQDALLKVPSEMVLFLKMNQDGHQACLRKFTCYHLTGKSFKTFGVSEILWTAIGFFNGESPTKYLHRTPRPCEDAPPLPCTAPNHHCPPCTPEDERKYVQIQSFVHKFIEEANNRWRPWN